MKAFDCRVDRVPIRTHCRRIILVQILCLCAAVVSARAGAQQAYPTRPIKLVVAYAPGGANDVVARIIGQKLGEELRQTVVVENKPGAGGIVGTESVARAEADGYTLLLGAGGAMTINPSI